MEGWKDKGKDRVTVLMAPGGGRTDRARGALSLGWTWLDGPAEAGSASCYLLLGRHGVWEEGLEARVTVQLAVCLFVRVKTVKSFKLFLQEIKSLFTKSDVI